MKGRTSFRSHGVALAEQYVKALEGGLKEKIWMEWHFLNDMWKQGGRVEENSSHGMALSLK